MIDLQERHTSKYIADTLNEVSKEWDISLENITAIVTDGAPNIMKAVDLLFENSVDKRHIPCFAHTLNLVAQNSISSVTNIKLLINKVKSIVAWFKHSVIGSDELRKISKSKLIQEVPTRWNSTFYMLERFIELRPFINDIVNRNISASMMVSAKDIEEITEIITVFKPL